jgi:hypothetical protein
MRKFLSHNKFGELSVANVMTEPWSLDYECHHQLHMVSPVDERTIEETLLRVDGAEIIRCGLTNVDYHCWLVCRGEPDQHLVEYALSPLAQFGATGNIASRIFFLARKQPARGTMRIRWQSSPDVFVDVPAAAVLQRAEALAIFTTFFQTRSIHPDFTTIPKPSNGYS